MSDFSLPFLERVKNVGLRSEEVRRLKSLAGYSKSGRVKGREGDDGHLSVLAKEDLEADIEKRFAALRDGMGYRRRDFEVVVGETQGSIRTPDLEYQVSVSLDPSDASAVIWRREVVTLGNPALVRTARFAEIFGAGFDTLFCEFREPAEIAPLIDDLEARETQGMRLDYDSRCSWCEIRRGETSPIIRIERNQLTVGGGSADARELTRMLADLTAFFSGSTALSNASCASEPEL